MEEGAKRDRHGRRITAPGRIEELVQEYAASGLTQAEFARRAGIKYPTFAGWVHRRRRKEGGAEQPLAVRFAQVQWPANAGAAGELSVTLPDGVVVRGGEAAAVAALVRALRS